MEFLLSVQLHLMIRRLQMVRDKRKKVPFKVQCLWYNNNDMLLTRRVEASHVKIELQKVI